MVNLLVYIEKLSRNNFIKFKGLILKLYLLTHGCKVGKHLRVHKFPKFRTIPKRNIRIGSNVTIGYSIFFETSERGKIIIGNKTNLTSNIVLCANELIEIGEEVLIAENVSIRDANHQISSSKSILSQPHSSKPVKIGNDVWIGAGSLILSGSEVPDGVVIGASSLVLGNSKIKSYAVYGGCPIKFLKNRN
jgi:acetyltransferase-like isoleucine patch superfamily enzyme